jgi:DNA gyrase subunit A
MRLQRLTNLEQNKINEEYDEVSALVSKLKGILADPQKVLDIIVEELEDIKKKYGDERRTEIVLDSGEIDIEDLIVEEDMVVTVSHQGYVKRNPATLYRSQRRGGRGKVGMGMKEDDFVERIFIASTHSYVLCFTNTGRVHWLKVHQIPQAGRAAKGKAIVNLIGISGQERVTAVLSVQEFVDGKFVFFATKRGIAKKTDLLAYSHPRVGGIIAITLDEGDELISVKLTDGTQDVFFGTKTGKAIRFNEKDVRSSGRTARGVTGIRMDKEDELVGMEILGDGNSIVTISENGYGKRTEVTEYRTQARGGKGMINLKTVPKVGFVSGIRQVVGNEDIILISNGGKIIRMRVDEVSLLHRSTQGVKLIGLEPGESLIGLARAER